MEKRTDWKKAYESQCETTKYIADVHARHKSYCNQRNTSSIILIIFLFITLVVAIIMWNNDSDNLRAENTYLKQENYAKSEEIAKLNHSVENLRYQVISLAQMKDTEEWTISLWANMPEGIHNFAWTNNKDFYVDGEQIVGR